MKKSINPIYFLVLVPAMVGLWKIMGLRKESPFIARTRQASKESVKKILAKIENSPKRTERVEDSSSVSSETYQKMATAFEYLAKSRRSLYRDTEREAILSRLREDPQAVAASSKYLLDLKLVKEQFDKQQAQARLFSIALLRETAKLGNLQPLEATIQNLTQELANTKTTDVGRQRDLEDLIASYIYVQKDTALAELDQLVSRLGYQSALKRQFIAGIYIGLQTMHSKEEIIARLEQVGISVKKDGQG